MKRSGRIKPKSKAQARRWSEWRWRPRKTLGKVLSVEVTENGLSIKAKLSKAGLKLVRKSETTPQRKRTLSREAHLRSWYWDVVKEFCAQMSPHDSKLWEGIKGYDPRICGRCGSGARLEADHTKGRGPNKWLGWLLQTLCHFCNCFLKRSNKGDEWDFRSEGFKAFLLKCWHRDWELDWHGRWKRKSKKEDGK